jgi:uncharacterized cupredoxin-like copper-binding protein
MIIGPIAALAFAGCGSASDSKTPATIKPSTPSSSVQKDAVTLDDFSINPTTTALKAGKVQFHVTNKGKSAHEFVVIDTNKKANHLGHGSRVPERGNIGETGNVRPGTSKTLVLNLRKGHYAVICNDPGHYMAGMHKDLYVS